jgi:hypothetical protein
MEEWYQFMNFYSLEFCALLGCYAASMTCYLPTFRDNQSVTSSRVKQPKNNVALFQAARIIFDY